MWRLPSPRPLTEPSLSKSTDKRCSCKVEKHRDLLQDRQQQINLRWFYVCVQSLLSIELKPELLQDGQVERLSSRAQHPDGPSDSHAEADSSSSGLSSAGESSSSQDTSVDRSITVADAAPVAMKDPKTKWDDDELQQMLQLKRSGLTHKAIAVGGPLS
jgi:hypothetical protein